jgi:hypothetical protein
VAQPEDKIGEKGLFPRINDYDKWAIKWGYQWRPEFKDEFAEKEQLMKETTNVLKQNPRLWFGGEGRDEDPRSQTEDLGDNSVKASEYGLKNLKRVMDNLPEWTREENDRYEDLSMMYDQVVGQYTRYMNHVLKNIGGRYRNNMPGQEPQANVPRERQQEALQYIGRNVFEAPEWLYPAHIINKVGVDPTAQQNSRQENVVGRVLTAYILNNLCSQRGSEGSYSVGDYLDDLFAEVWKPLAGSDWQKSERRNLQRVYVAQLNKLVNPDEKATAVNRVDNSDAMLYLLQHLDKVEQYLKAQPSQGIDGLHYQDLLERLTLVRERRKSPSAR